MALLDGILKKGIITDDQESADRLLTFMKGMEPKLRQHNRQMIDGDGTYAGYRTLRDFYKGRQWTYQKEEGETMRTYNYTFTIVENMTAFLTNEPPQMTCPPSDVTDPIERKMAEGRGKILEAVHEENRLGLVFQKAARTGSIYGDSYIFGAYPEFETITEESTEVDEETGMRKMTERKELRSIRYWNIDRPWTVRPIWKTDDFTHLHGFVKRYRIFVGDLPTMFGKEIEEAGYKIPKEGERDTEQFAMYDDDSLPKVTVKEMWTEEEWIVTIGNGDVLIKYMRHNWGFVPLHYVPNIHLPGEPRGTADIENELDPQQEYNERTSDFGDLIKELAKPTYWGKNLGSVSEVRSGQTVIYEFGEDAELQAMPKSGEPGALSSYTAERKNDIINLSGMNQVLYPGNQVLQATGRALSVVMQGVNNKIALRKGWWEATFKELNKQILFLAEKYIPEARFVINGNYKSDVFISSVLMRSVTDELNKFNARTQSLTTTQKNIGLANPSEEQKLMKEELEDELLVAEIAKQPGLIMQIIAQRAAAQQQQGMGDPNAMQPELNDDEVELDGFGGGFSPMASESDNNAGGTPAPARGQASPVSSEGAVRQAASRTGARTQITRRTP
jgi:hypothetical protein